MSSGGLRRISVDAAGASGSQNSYAPVITSDGTRVVFAASAPKLDSGAWASCTSPTTRTGLVNGKHTFTVRAVDAAGDVDATPATRTFSVR